MSLKQNTLYNIAGALVPTAVSLVVVPLYLDRIGEARYGIMALVWLFLGYFGLFDLGLSRASANLVAQLESAPDVERENVFWTALCLNTGLGTLGGLALYCVGIPLLGQWVRMPPNIRHEALLALPWLALAVPVATVTGVLTGVLEGRKRFGALNTLQAIGTLIFQIAPLVVAYAVGPGLELLIPVAVGARIVSTLPLAILVKRELPLRSHPHFQSQLVHRLLRYGAWITVTGVVSPILTSIDRFIIGVIRGAAAIAFYAVPFNLVSRVGVFPSALSRALFPNLSAASSGEAIGLSREAIHMLNAILVPLIVFGLWALHPFLELWVGIQFTRHAAPVGEILLLGIWINGLASVPFTMLQAQGRPDLVARFHVLELVPFLAVLWVGLQFWGLAGAAWAWTLRVAGDALFLFWASDLGSLVFRTLWPAGLLVMGTFFGAYFLTSAPKLLWAGLAVIFFASACIWALYTTPRLWHELVGMLRYTGLTP